MRFYRERLSAEHPSTVMDGLIGLFEHEQVHFSKMIASLMPILNMLTSGDLRGLLSPDAAAPEDGRRLASMAGVIAAGEVLYVGLDALSDAMVGSAIGSILIADLAAVAGDRYNHQGRPSPVNVFIDEAAEVVNDPFIQLLNKGRGAGLRLTVATQTFADFAARTGSEAKARQVLGNINNLIALRVLDAETQEYVAESLPKARVVSILRAHGSTTDSTHPVLYTGNTGRAPGRGRGRAVCAGPAGATAELRVCRQALGRAHRQGSVADPGRTASPAERRGGPRRRPMSKTLLRAVLTKRADRDALAQAEIDWPDSRGLLERLALGLRERDGADDLLRVRVWRPSPVSAIAAHRAARKAQVPDRDRFAAFVQGIAEALDPSEQGLLIDAMTVAQRRLLDARRDGIPSEPALAAEVTDA